MSHRFQTLRYTRPPDSIVTQIDVYTEEKFEDEEDMRERTRAAFREFESGSELELAFTALNSFILQEKEIGPPVVSIIRNIISLLGQVAHL